MASYFIGSNNTGSGFGGGGNFFAQLGEIGPAWQNSMLQGLNTQNAFNEFQNKQIVDPYRVQAAASAYGTQALQNQYASELAARDLRNAYRMMQTGNLADAQQMARNLGMNPDQIQYGRNLVQQAPTQVQPEQPAQTGGYAATAPSIPRTPRVTPPEGFSTWSAYYNANPNAASLWANAFENQAQSVVAPQYIDATNQLF